MGRNSKRKNLNKRKDRELEADILALVEEGFITEGCMCKYDILPEEYDEVCIQERFIVDKVEKLNTANVKSWKIR